MTIRQFLTYLAILVICIVLYAAIEFLIIKYNGTFVPAPDIPRTPIEAGSGPKLSYVVMGDSTSIGQGSDYEHSYAMTSTHHLAEKYAVTLTNIGISGARVNDIATSQLPKALQYKPDVVLLGVGANDTTHFTNLTQMKQDLQKIVDALKQANPNVIIVATRSPALDSVSRFPLVSKYILGLQTQKVNAVFDDVIKKNDLTPALVAEKTRAAFLADPSLTAADNFHPNARGYALWTPIVNDALDQALEH